jgi:predicted nucleic acid-binding protein
MKAFLDTNVLLSSAHSNGLCRELLYWPSKDMGQFDAHYLAPSQVRVEYVSSDRVMMELSRNLTRKFRHSPASTVAMVREISKLLNLVPAAAQAVKCPDETDGWILADAVEAKCDYFITGDRVVLALYSVQGMRIITPREMMDYLYTGKPIPKFEAHQDRAKYLVQRLEKIY